MKIKQIIEKLEKFVEEQYKIYDDDWEDNELLTEQDVINFIIEHFLDRQEEFSSLQDFVQPIGREDGTDNFYKSDGTYNLVKYDITNESKILFGITQKIRNNQSITFDEAKKLLKFLDFKIKKI